jgi:hypothetical protein
MLPVHVALVSESQNIDPADVARVAAALQKQATRDFGPVWSVDATIDALPTLDDVPIDYWPIVVLDNLKGGGGVHMDQHHKPYALVDATASWSLTASHEMCEMLADPFGNRKVAGQSPKEDQGRVELLVEVSDPIEAPEFAYTINGYLVSDFITPRYYDPDAARGVRYDFSGAISKPREVMKGGYISWHDPVSNHLWQYLRVRGDEFKDLGEGNFEGNKSIREWVDEQTEHPGIDAGLPEDDATLADARALGDADHRANVARAELLRGDMRGIMSE